MAGLDVGLKEEVKVKDEDEDEDLDFDPRKEKVPGIIPGVYQHEDEDFVSDLLKEDEKTKKNWNDIFKGIKDRFSKIDHNDPEYVEEERYKLNIIKFIKKNYPESKTITFNNNSDVKIEEIDDIFVAKFKNETLWKFDGDGKIDPKAGKKLKKILGPHYTEILKENTKKEKEVQLEMTEFNLENKELRESVSRLKDENEELRESVSRLEFIKERYENAIREGEENLKKYNEENIRLKEEIRRNPTEQKLKEEHLELIKKVRDQTELINDFEGELSEKTQLIKELEEKLKIKEQEETRQNEIVNERVKELEIMLEEKTFQLEKLAEERGKITSKLSMKQKIKEIFKKHGFSITAIVLSIGTIITSVVFKVTSTISSGLKSVKDIIVSNGKEIAQFLPAIIAAISNLIFKTAESVLGFLAKYSWLLILFVVTLFIEKFTSKKK